MFFDCRHPYFGNSNSAILVVVIRVKSYVDSFLAIDIKYVPVRISINKLDLRPNWIVAGVLATSESYFSVVFFDPLLNRFSCFPDLHFAVLIGSL